MNTFDASTFTKKANEDLARAAAGEDGNINLIPSIPGMGILTAIQDECRNMESGTSAKSMTVTMDHVRGNGETGSGSSNDAQVIVVDAGQIGMSDTDQQALIDFAKKASEKASVWIVGGNTNELSASLDSQGSLFQSRIRRLRSHGVASTAPGAKSFKP